MLDIIFIVKVLLFLTGGKPDDSGSPESVYSTLSHLNGQLNNSVVVLTYFLSTGWYCFYFILMLSVSKTQKDDQH